MIHLGQKFWATKLKCRVTLPETNIAPENGILKMIFLFPRWDMLIPWRVQPVLTEKMFLYPRKDFGVLEVSRPPHFWFERGKTSLKSKPMKSAPKIYQSKHKKSMEKPSRISVTPQKVEVFFKTDFFPFVQARPIFGAKTVSSQEGISVSCLVWFGLVWFGLVWCGLFWFVLFCLFWLVWLVCLFGLFGLFWFVLFCLFEKIKSKQKKPSPETGESPRVGTSRSGRSPPSWNVWWEAWSCLRPSRTWRFGPKTLGRFSHVTPKSGVKLPFFGVKWKKMMQLLLMILRKFPLMVHSWGGVGFI